MLFSIERCTVSLCLNSVGTEDRNSIDMAVQLFSDSWAKHKRHTNGHTHYSPLPTAETHRFFTSPQINRSRRPNVYLLCTIFICQKRHNLLLLCEQIQNTDRFFTSVSAPCSPHSKYTYQLPYSFSVFMIHIFYGSEKS